MNRYRRLPSLIVLLLIFSAGAFYVHRYGRANGNGVEGLEALQAIISKEKDKASKETWFAYAEALAQAGKFELAAQAYKTVLQKDPSHRPAKVGCALSIAQAKDQPKRADDLYAYMKDMVFTEPKLAMDLLDRPELREYLSERRFELLQREAKAQAMD